MRLELLLILGLIGSVPANSGNSVLPCMSAMVALLNHIAHSQININSSWRLNNTRKEKKSVLWAWTTAAFQQQDMLAVRVWLQGIEWYHQAQAFFKRMCVQVWQLLCVQQVCITLCVFWLCSINTDSVRYLSNSSLAVRLCHGFACFCFEFRGVWA